MNAPRHENPVYGPMVRTTIPFQKCYSVNYFIEHFWRYKRLLLSLIIGLHWHLVVECSLWRMSVSMWAQYNSLCTI